MNTAQRKSFSSKAAEWIEDHPCIKSIYLFETNHDKPHYKHIIAVIAPYPTAQYRNWANETGLSLNSSKTKSTIKQVLIGMGIPDFCLLTFASLNDGKDYVKDLIDNEPPKNGTGTYSHYLIAENHLSSLDKLQEIADLICAQNKDWNDPDKGRKWVVDQVIEEGRKQGIHVSEKYLYDNIKLSGGPLRRGRKVKS